jgi:hypothetical protein
VLSFLAALGLRYAWKQFYADRPRSFRLYGVQRAVRGYPNPSTGKGRFRLRIL